MAAADVTQVGRLAMREEGSFWMAYYAMPDTMDDAILLGSIAMAGIAGKPAVQLVFMTLMRDLVADIIEERTGTRPVWPHALKPAPPGERRRR